MFKSRKLIATLMIVAMLLTLIPMAAFAASDACDMLSFKFESAQNGFNATGIISGTSVAVTVPAGTDVTDLVATFTVSDGATVKVGANPQTSGTTSNNFSAPVSYDVTAEDTTTTKTYTVTVTQVTPSGTSNRFASIATIDKTSVTADDDSEAKVTVYVRDELNAAVAGASVIAVSSRSTTDTINGSKGYAVATSDASGKVEFKVKSAIPGSAKIAVATGTNATKTNVEDFLAGKTNTSEATADIIKVFNLSFTADSTNSVKLSKVDGVTNPAAFVLSGKTANGVAYYELTYQVLTSKNAPVADQEITISANKANVSFNKTSATTDVNGEAKFRVFADKSGSYVITAKSGGKDVDTTVAFGAGDVTGIELASDNGVLAAKDKDFKFKVKLFNINGQIVHNNTNTMTIGALALAPYEVTMEATLRPADVKLPEKITADLSGATVNAKDSIFEVVIPGAQLNKEGEYTIRVSTSTGKYVDVNFTVKKQGDITRIELSYPQTTLRKGQLSGSATVKKYDAAGVMVEADNTNFVSENISFSATPAYRVAGITAANGVVEVTSDKDYLGEVTITAIDTSNKLTASFKINITKEIENFTLTSNGLVVGQDNILTLKFVDLDGNAVSLGARDAGAGDVDPTLDYYVVSKPAGAIVTLDTPISLVKDLVQKGETNLTVYSTVAGEAVLQIVVDNGLAGTANKKYTNNISLKFGEKLEDAEKGAKSLILQIGSKVGFQDGVVIDTGDFAPFIKNSTTFVPVRVLANAFNAEAAWDGATNTATITRKDIKITLVAGDKNVKVEKDGVETTIEANEALFINENNRLCAPMRAIADAFGADLDYGPKEGAVEWVSFTQN